MTKAAREMKTSAKTMTAPSDTSAAAISASGRPRSPTRPVDTRST
ncbi:hypothetical protein SHIRM173S_09515 [Streptomyces hirsutus]